MKQVNDSQRRKPLMNEGGVEPGAAPDRGGMQRFLSSTALQPPRQVSRALDREVSFEEDE